MIPMEHILKESGKAIIEANTITIKPCCWVCEHMERKTVGEGGLGPGMRAWTCQHPNTYNDEEVVLPYNTKCRYSFQLKKELS